MIVDLSLIFITGFTSRFHQCITQKPIECREQVFERKKKQIEYRVWRKFCNISYFTYIWTQVNDTILILLSKDRPWKTVQIVWIDLSIVWLRRTTSRVAPCSILVKEISSCKIEFNFQIGHYWQTRTKDIADTQESKKKKPTNQISRLLKDIRRDVMGPNVYLLRLLLDRTCVKSLFYILSLFSLFSPCRDNCTHVKSIISIKALLPKKIIIIETCINMNWFQLIFVAVFKANLFKMPIE